MSLIFSLIFILLIAIILYLLRRESGFKSSIAVLSERILVKDGELEKDKNLLKNIDDKKQQLERELLESKSLGKGYENNFNILQQRINELEQKNNDIVIINQNFLRENSELKSNLEYSNKRLDTLKQEIAELHQRSQQNFENLANKILQEKSEKFTEINKKNIFQILEPLGQNIDNFKKQVSDIYDKDSKERIVLQEEVKKLFEQTNKISNEANNLASALKGSSKKQGNWGEMILETILQYSGLQKDIHYFKEKSFNNDEGKNLRPDFQINLPDNRVIIIDSKVSLVAYNKFCETLNEEESQKFLEEHIKSVKNHIEILSKKNYDDLEKAIDFTIMFMPIEPAYLLAIQADKNLWAFAYEKRIMMVSPTNLIACLKIIQDLWKREMQSKTTLEIVNCGEALYNKFVGFVDSMLRVGNRLDASKEAYEEAIKQLKSGRGNLIHQAEKLKSLGLKTDKKIAIDYEINDA